MQQTHGRLEFRLQSCKKLAHVQAADTFFNPIPGWSNPTQEARLVMEEQGVQMDISEVRSPLHAFAFGLRWAQRRVQF